MAQPQESNEWQWRWLENSSTLIARRASANLAEILLAQITALPMKSKPWPLLAPHGKTSVLSRSESHHSFRLKFQWALAAFERKCLKDKINHLSYCAVIKSPSPLIFFLHHLLVLSPSFFQSLSLIWKSKGNKKDPQSFHSSSAGWWEQTTTKNSASPNSSFLKQWANCCGSAPWGKFRETSSLSLTLSAALVGHSGGRFELALAQVLVFCDWENLQPAQGQHRHFVTTLCWGPLQDESLQGCSWAVPGSQGCTARHRKIFGHPGQPMPDCKKDKN